MGKTKKLESMKFNQHIYVCNIVLKKFNILKTTNQTVVLIFTIYCTYLFICCAILSKGLGYCARFTDTNPYS